MWHVLSKHAYISIQYDFNTYTKHPTNGLAIELLYGVKCITHVWIQKHRNVEKDFD